MQFLKNELNKKPHVKRGKLHLGGKKTKKCFFWEVICQYFFHWQKRFWNRTEIDNGERVDIHKGVKGVKFWWKNMARDNFVILRRAIPKRIMLPMIQLQCNIKEQEEMNYPKMLF